MTTDDAQNVELSEVNNAEGEPVEPAEDDEEHDPEGEDGG